MELQKEFAKVIAKAWSDPQFKEQFLKNPEKVFKEHGISIPLGQQIKVCENTDSTFYFVIPQKPEKALSEKELESFAAAAGGGCWESKLSGN